MTRDELSARYYDARIEAERKAARTQLVLVCAYALAVVAAIVGVTL